MKIPILLSAALLLLLLPGVPAAFSSQTPIKILVTNSVTPSPDRTYSTYVVYRGILIGGMRRLQMSNKGFKFTYKEDANYGPSLQSVNGLVRSPKRRTYWQLLVQSNNDTTIRPNVGIGCYIPNANDTIILKYSTY